jgi:hypothetical protein
MPFYNPSNTASEAVVTLFSTPDSQPQSAEPLPAGE